MTDRSFHPPVRALMGPGPSDLHPRVREALTRPLIGHLDPACIDLMNGIHDLLQYAFQTKNEFTVAVSGPGTLGMETCFANLVEPGEKVVVCQNGFFGGRMKEMAERYGGKVILIEDMWGTPVTPDKLASVLKADPEIKSVAFVHAETSTGVLSDVKVLVDIAHSHGCLTIVDAVTSLGGVALKMDEWGIDAVYSGSQKCLASIPGLSPLSFSPSAVEKSRKRKSKTSNWFLDINMLINYWLGAKRAYHHTAPVHSFYALHEALVILSDEGLENAWARHRKHHEALKAGLEAMGLELLGEESSRLPQLNAVVIPDGIEDVKVRSELLNSFGIEIGGGLGALAGKIWRIGLMGYGCNMKNITLCLAALESVLGGMHANIRKGAAVTAAAERVGQ